MVPKPRRTSLSNYYLSGNFWAMDSTLLIGKFVNRLVMLEAHQGVVLL